MQSVELIASGYEWVCPKCGMLNHEIEVTPIVICPFCQERCEVAEYHHAYE